MSEKLFESCCVYFFPSQDCQEAYENGYQTSKYTGPLLIQPSGSLEPFQVSQFKLLTEVLYFNTRILNMNKIKTSNLV